MLNSDDKAVRTFARRSRHEATQSSGPTVPILEQPNVTEGTDSADPNFSDLCSGTGVLHQTEESDLNLRLVLSIL